MQSLSDLERRLLATVTHEPQSATEIFLTFHDLVTPEGVHKSLTDKRRRQRREIGAHLEDFAEWGLIECDTVERGGHDVPVYFKRRLEPVGRPRRRGARAA